MEITLTELLDAREERARIQSELIRRHGAPLVCFTMNIAGPVKTSPLIERAFSIGTVLIKDALSDIDSPGERMELGKCGPVLYYSVKADAKAVKSRLSLIEDTHPIGRLFDMDVIDTDGRKLERERERCCLICGKRGRACAAGRLHPLSEITATTERMLTEHLLSLDVARIGTLAREAMLREVYTTPKPGLVDTENTGSHRDMTLSHFERSAEALEPYFRECARVGYTLRAEDADTRFARLRLLGISAEESMYAATGGVNTHKGLIFSLGIVAGAVGTLMRPDGYFPTTDEILVEAAHLARLPLSELEKLGRTTAGARAFLEHGRRGIRGEAADGFPSVRSVSLPVYLEALSRGKSKNDAGVLALLHLIATIYDTSIYNRGGDGAVTYARGLAKELISLGDPTHDEVRKMNAELTRLNLSPGGCADLLAVTYFLAEIEEIRKGSEE